jgi:hypothetical protein
MPDKKRPLNMEEKRHLQKLLFSDIQIAGEHYRNARKQAREELQKRLVEEAPETVFALLAEYKIAVSTMDRVDEELSKLGYALSGYPEKALAIAYGKLPNELIKFDEETSRRDKGISDLKRDYTLRLFAGAEEAKELFATLANELGKIAN